MKFGTQIGLNHTNRMDRYICDVYPDAYNYPDISLQTEHNSELIGDSGSESSTQT